jgi:hypothetical protein
LSVEIARPAALKATFIGPANQLYHDNTSNQRPASG